MAMGLSKPATTGPVLPQEPVGDVVITIPAADAAHLSEAYRYAQFSPDGRGDIQLAAVTLQTLRRVLDLIDAAVNP